MIGATRPARPLCALSFESLILYLVEPQMSSYGGEVFRWCHLRKLGPVSHLKECLVKFAIGEVREAVAKPFAELSYHLTIVFQKDLVLLCLGGGCLQPLVKS